MSDLKETTKKAFDPSEHILKLERWTKDENGFNVKVTDDYLEVKYRLCWFRDQFPNGTIETEPITIDLDREVVVERTRWVGEKGNKRKETYTVSGVGYAMFRARVSNGEGGVATGHKSESAVDFGDYIEKAETGAIGRALAALGFGTQFTAGELDEGERIVDSPVTAKEEKPPKDAATLEQMRTIREISNQLKRPLPSGMKDFTQAQAGEAIDQLKKQLRATREKQSEASAS